jgi:hypothetical protein
VWQATKLKKKLVLTDGLYFLSAVHTPQHNVIEKDTTPLPTHSYFKIKFNIFSPPAFWSHMLSLLFVLNVNLLEAYVPPKNALSAFYLYYLPRNSYMFRRYYLATFRELTPRFL